MYDHKRATDVYSFSLTKAKLQGATIDECKKLALEALHNFAPETATKAGYKPIGTKIMSIVKATFPELMKKRKKYEHKGDSQSIQGMIEKLAIENGKLPPRRELTSIAEYYGKTSKSVSSAIHRMRLDGWKITKSRNGYICRKEEKTFQQPLPTTPPAIPQQEPEYTVEQLTEMLQKALVKAASK